MKALLTIGLMALLVLACGSGDTAAPMNADAGIGKGEQLFAMNCVLCHGKDGKLGFNGAKDLTASTLTKAEMIAIVTNGKAPTMMPYKNMFTAKEIDTVVDYVRTLGKRK
ncbi:MAG: c-type cytochrome [Flavobacteriales bacterium]